jgi:predicted regulator of Ras-like GTPase activity (Roadblock/LC7/MglB family)
LAAAMLTMSSRTMTELKRGRLKQLFLSGDEGYVVIMQAGPHAVLIALARKEAKLGLLFFDMTRSSESISKVLS